MERKKVRETEEQRALCAGTEGLARRDRVAGCGGTGGLGRRDKDRHSTFSH